MRAFAAQLLLLAAVFVGGAGAASAWLEHSCSVVSDGNSSCALDAGRPVITYNGTRVSPEQLSIDLYIPNFQNELWTCTNLLILHNGLSRSLHVRLNVINMDEFDAGIALCAPPNTRILHLTTVGKGGTPLIQVFRAAAEIVAGQVAVFADSDAVNVALGWDASLAVVMQRYEWAAISPRGKLFGEKSAFFGYMEWNWMAARAASYKRVLVPLQGRGEFYDWGHFFQNASASEGHFLWEECERVTAGKSPTLCRHAGSPWVMHSFYLSRRHLDTNFDTKFIVTKEQEMQLITTVMTRFSHVFVEPEMAITQPNTTNHTVK